MKKTWLIIGLCIILLSGLVNAIGFSNTDTKVYWAMEDLQDSTPNNIDLTGSATSGTVGIINNAYSFNGVGNYLNAGDITFIDSFPYTVSFWAYHSTDGKTPIGKWGNGDTFSTILSSSQGVNYEFKNNSGDGVGGWFADIKPTTNNWNHIVLINNGTTITAYLNNVKSSTEYHFIGSVETGTDALILGDRSLTSHNYYAGRLDEISFFDKELTDVDVNFLYASGSPSSNEQYPFNILNNFSITATDFFSQKTIYNFSAILNGVTYYSNISNGKIITLINKSKGLNYTINISAENYFNKSYYWNTSTDLIVEPFQSIINLTGKNPLGTSLNNWTLFNGSTILLNASSSSGIVYLTEGNYDDLSIISNNNNFVNQELESFTISALDNKTINLTIYDYILNITAKNIITNSYINNFSITIKNIQNNITRSYETITGKILVGVINTSYNLSIISEKYYSYNNSIILNINESKDYEFKLYENSYINFSQNTSGIIQSGETFIREFINISELYINKTEIPVGYVTITFNDAGGENYQQLYSYYNDQSTIIIDEILIQNVDLQQVIKIVSNSQPLQNARVCSRYPYLGEYWTTYCDYTNSQGEVTIQINDENTYYICSQKEGYQSICKTEYIPATNTDIITINMPESISEAGWNYFSNTCEGNYIEDKSCSIEIITYKPYSEICINITKSDGTSSLRCDEDSIGEIYTYNIYQTYDYYNITIYLDEIIEKFWKLNNATNEATIIIDYTRGNNSGKSVMENIQEDITLYITAHIIMIILGIIAGFMFEKYFNKNGIYGTGMWFLFTGIIGFYALLVPATIIIIYFMLERYLPLFKK